MIPLRRTAVRAFKCWQVLEKFHRSGVNVSELDAEEWRRKLAEAERRARVAGRNDVADYVVLRAANDEARHTGIEWLMAVFTGLAGEANRTGANIQYERDDAHRFRVNTGEMVGTRLTLRSGGVRALTIEAGWPRTPQDGIVRGGGIANGRISHFGNQAAGDDLVLIRQNKDNTSQWFVLETTGARTNFSDDYARSHIKKLLGGARV